MLVIDDASEDLFIFNFAPIGTILGATDRFEAGSWVWGATGNPLSYTNWADGQPGVCDIANCEPENYLGFAFPGEFLWHNISGPGAYICEWEE